MNANHRINLGDKVKDKVSGLVGIATARTEWLHGCVRIAVQPQEVKDGKPVDAHYIDEPQLEVVEVGVVAHTVPAERTYGPRQDETSRPQGDRR
jgi:valyl-tRNA synthetase